MEFQEKVIVVTGAAGDIGRELTKRFYREGALMVLVDINQEGLDQFIKEQNFDNRRILPIYGDMREEEQVSSYVQKVVGLFGSIDVFVHCVGTFGKIGMAIELSPDDLRDVFQTNTLTAFLNYKYISAVMQKQQRGSVLFIGSFSGMRGIPFCTPYVIAAHGLAGLTRTSALECSQSGVRVNSICPSPVNTESINAAGEQLKPGDTEEVHDEVAQIVPLGRYAEVDEVLELALFLSSDRAKFITGSNYALDGGITSK